MKETVPEPHRFQFVAGALCLDFCNTVGGKRGRPNEKERLHAYPDFTAWCEQAGLLSPAAAAALCSRARRKPALGKGVLKRAIALREAICRIFSALSFQKPPTAADVALLNAELSPALQRLRVARHRGEFHWDWAGENPQLADPLGPIARSAAELLIDSHARTRIQECNSETCGWLFLDASKNHSRRWCDMRDCGNRAKVRRFRLKKGAA